MDWLDTLIDSLAAHQSVTRVYLFGSRARGDKDDRSDFDLAIDAQDISEQDWFTITESVENAETLYKIDLVHLQKAPESLYKNILRDGKILYDATTANGSGEIGEGS